MTQVIFLLLCPKYSNQLKIIAKDTEFLTLLHLILIVSMFSLCTVFFSRCL